MRFAAAIVLSLLVHAALAALLALGFFLAPEPDALAELDLSSVELSFAEREDAAAAAAPMPPAAPPEPRQPRDPPPPEPPPVERPMPLPPELEAVALPEPRPEPPPVMETPPPAPAAPAAAPRQAKVDAPPQPEQRIRPDYPRGARQRGEQGEVTLEIDVRADGSVDGVRVVTSSGYSELDEAAKKAVRPARFRPATSDGSPVSSTARLKLAFRLR